MIEYGITNYKGEFVRIPRSVKKFISDRIDHYFTDKIYGHDFIEELVEIDLISKYGYESFRVFIL